MIFWLEALGLLVAVALGFFIYLTLAVNAQANHQDRVTAVPSVGTETDAFLRSLQGSAGQPPYLGNTVELFQNGDGIFPPMLDAIRGARSTIHFATYIFTTGSLARTFATAFADAARRGVVVRIVLDSEGSGDVSESILREMRDAGCLVAWYRRASWTDWMRYNRRSHRRLLIVDGTVAFTGGAAIGDLWLGNADAPDHWRDTHARFTGPVVAAFQGGFADNWNLCTEELLLHVRDYPALAPTGNATVCAVVSSPSNGASPAQRVMAACIAGAGTSLRITNPYFLPTPAFVEALVAARARGVEVDVVMPGALIDMPIVRRASRHVWEPLLLAGVRLHEFQPTMIHCKTMVIDDTLLLVGSVNFDPRSFSLNAECAAVVQDPALVAEATRVFAGDRARCIPVRLESVQSRGVVSRLLDSLAYLVRAQL